MPFSSRMTHRRPALHTMPLLALLLAGLLALIGSGGCTRGIGGSGDSGDRLAVQPAGLSPRHAADPSAASSGLVEVGAIERSPAYRQAVLSFSGKDYRGALGRIDALLRTPGLSPAALTFLNRQQALCQDALAGRKSGATSPSIATASAAPRSAARPIRTASDADCGPRALLLVCQTLKIPARLPALRTAAGTTADGTTMAGLAKAAQSVGLTADGVQMDRSALSNLSKPAVSWVDGNHYVAVLSVNGDMATVHDPNKDGEEEMPLGGPTGLLARSGGMLLTLSQKDKLASTVP